MKIDILTLFPSMFEEFFNTSILKRSIESKVATVNIINIRDFSTYNNKKVDDTPFGGGAGMLMMIEPIVSCIRSVKKENSKVIYLSPKGNIYNQEKAYSLSKEEHLILLCGHYEGVDERVLDYVDEEISIGDYILSGGEIGAMVLSDSIIRLLNGSISGDSLKEESFENNLLEYPQYTYPRSFEGKEVPEVLISGNHKLIEKWRKEQSIEITKKRRKDLYDKYNKE